MSTLLDGQVIRVIQRVNLPDGGRPTSKFYFAASLADPVERHLVTLAIKAWLETVYANLQTMMYTHLTLGSALIDVIGWQDDAWRTLADFGWVNPADPFATGEPWVPDQVAALIVFTTPSRRTKRPYYQWGMGRNRTVGGKISGWAILRLTDMALDMLDPVDLGGGDILAPCVVHASRNGLEFLTGFILHRWLSALSRRRPTG